MKWLEIIHIRSGRNKLELLVGELSKLLHDNESNTDSITISVFRHSSLSSDFSLHLMHKSSKNWSGKSELALRLVDSLKQFGLVDHVVWLQV